MTTAAAEPTLASTLWANHLAAQQDDTTQPPAKRRKLATSLRDLDHALEGGLEYGSIHCISAEPSSNSVHDLTLALIVSHLLASQDTVVTVIDTTLGFDIRGLHQRLGDALRERNEDGEGKVMEVLGRVSVMKAFDFVGMTECLAEVRESLERPAVSDPAEKRPAAPPKGTIDDSEDEGDDMLDDAPSPPLHPPPPLAAHPSVKCGPPNVRSGFLLINNITQPTAPLLKNNHVQAQALLTSFMRSLSHLTESHDLCTLLLNNASTYAVAQAKAEPSPSIFSSCALRPALGKTFTYLVDVHVLVHEVPRTAEGARAVYGGERQGREEVEMGRVFEVLQDRYGGRVGSWAAFSVDAEGRPRDVG